METNQSAMTTKPSMQSGAAVAEKAAAAGRGVKATEEQARAIICTAKRAVEEAAANKAKTIGDGAGKSSSSSLKILPRRPEEQGAVVFRNSSPPRDLHRVFVFVVVV